MRKVFTLLAIMLFSLNISTAGDLSFKFAFFPDELHHGNQEDIVVEYANLNTNFSVYQIQFQMTLIRTSDQQVMDQRQEALDSLEAGETTQVNFGPLDYLNLDPNTEYVLAFDTQQEFDENLTNNYGEHQFFLLPPFDRDFVIGQVDQYLTENFSQMELQSTHAYLGMDFYPAGSVITTFDTEEFSTTLEHDSWLVLIDWDIVSKYQKPVTYMILSEGQDHIFHDVNWYPYVDDWLWVPDPFNPDGIIFGDPPLFLSQTIEIDYEVPVPTEKTDSVCAIIVTGKDSVLQSALDYDKKNLLWILQKNGNGQELSNDNVKCLNGGTKAEIKAAIEELKKNYKKIYFYYTGHGAKDGRMCTNDSSKNWMTYDELFKDLFGTDATEIVVVVDACYAGTALKAAEDNKDKKGKKVEVFTSSDSNKTSRVVWYHLTADTNVKWCESFFTRAITQCSKDTLANTDKDTVISFKEAFDWARKQNPTFGSDSLNKRQNPQSFTADSRVTLETIKNWLTDYLNENYSELDLTKILGYAYPKLLPPGTEIVTFDTDEYSIVLDYESWFVMLDWDPQSKYSKPVQYLFFDQINDQPIIEDVNWFPVIDGNTWHPDPFALIPPPILIGEPPIFLPPPLPPLDITGPVPNPTQDSVCAIIVTGNDSTMQGAFDYDRDWIKWFLQKNDVGEELGDGNVEVLDKATKAEIIAAIKKLKENYSKIYFFYAGHGSKSGKICTNDSSQHWLSYQELFMELYCTKASDITVVLDACYSGLAVAAAKNDTTRGKRKVSVFTASDSTKTSKNVWYRSTTDTTNRWCQGYFTRNFVLCSTDSLANKDKDSIITFQEAFDWVRNQNPTYGSDSINTTQNPQGFVDDTRDTTTLDIEAILRLATQSLFDESPEGAIVYWNPLPLEGDWEVYPIHYPELALPTTQQELYYGWIDWYPGSSFEHETILYSYDPVTGELLTQPALWYPIAIDPLGNELLLEDQILHGELLDLINETPANTISDEAESVEQDQVCAILVSGTDKRLSNRDDVYRQQVTFECNIEEFKKELTKEKLGPKLEDKDVQLLKGIGKDSLCSILENMVGKYKKVYFYYSGHGSKDGKMCLGDSKKDWLSYKDLMKKISDINAEDNCILIDACYSGLASDYIGDGSNFAKTDVSLVTGSNGKKLTWNDYEKVADEGKKWKGYSVYSRNFFKCFGDPNADKNNDEKTSFLETFNWVKNQKPKTVRGKDIDSLQCPTINSKVDGKIDEEKKEASFGENDLKIENIIVDSFFDIAVRLEIEEQKHESTDPKIHELSGNRSWNISADAENGTFKVDLIFQLSAQYEKLIPELPNILGMCWREDENDEWKPQYPSVHNKDDNTILCGNTDHFSDWVVGIIAPQGTNSIDSKFLINNVEYGPNPFKNVMNFEFNLDKPESFSIEVVDITGRRFDFINTKDYGVGTFSVNLDGSKYPSGTYYCRLISESGIRTIKLVKE